MESPPVYDGKSNMEYQPPGTAEWKARAWEHIQKLEEAVRAACLLIWQADAAFVLGGTKMLDSWVDEHKALVGFDTGD